MYGSGPTFRLLYLNQNFFQLGLIIDMASYLAVSSWVVVITMGSSGPRWMVPSIALITGK